MKKITTENYYKPDDIIKNFGAVNFETGEQWAVTEDDILNFVDKITIDELVPDDIKELIEVSKALYAYGYLYWTFFTLSQEQSYKAFEAAISSVHKRVYGSNFSTRGKKRLQLSDMIQKLINSGNIPHEKKARYDAIRELRNMSFHPSMQSQWGLVAYDTVFQVIEEINSLFQTLEKQN